ncbi:MAG: hypothetical protein WCL27_16470, partial [Betaproteobacteria bacterium]
MTSSDTGNNLAVIESTANLPVQAKSDAHLVDLWIASSNSPHTRRARAADARAFVDYVGKPLPMVTVGDLYSYAGSVSGSDSTRARK